MVAALLYCSGFQYSGCMVNHVDIAPPFAGLLFGISNTAATLPGFMAPYAIGKLTTNVSARLYYDYREAYSYTMTYREAYSYTMTYREVYSYTMTYREAYSYTMTIGKFTLIL